MAKYVLRAFDRSLAETGFECVMLTGSYGAGSIIDTDDLPTNIKGPGTIVVLANDRLKLTLSGTNYIFNNTGRCTDSENSKWRLMLAEKKSEMSVEEVLNAIKDELITMNDHLNDINTSIGSFITNLNNRMAALDDHITSSTEAIIDAMPVVPEFHCNYTPPSNK